jgi:hypothetical protein
MEHKKRLEPPDAAPAQHCAFAQPPAGVAH